METPEDYLETITAAMAMVVGEESLPDDFDSSEAEILMGILSSWVINTFAEYEEPEDLTAGEPSSDEYLRDLIENAVACAYLFARMTGSAPNQPTEPNLTQPNPALTAEIVETLLATGSVTLSIIVE
jgi:hypothetical protein